MRAENPGNAGVRPEVLDGAERERERERCVSDADASSYGPFRARNDPQHICPERTHANTTPHHLTRSLSTTSPAARAQANPEDRPKPSPISNAPKPREHHYPILIHNPSVFCNPLPSTGTQTALRSRRGPLVRLVRGVEN